MMRWSHAGDCSDFRVSKPFLYFVSPEYKDSLVDRICRLTNIKGECLEKSSYVISVIAIE